MIIVSSYERIKGAMIAGYDEEKVVYLENPDGRRKYAAAL